MQTVIWAARGNPDDQQMLQDIMSAAGAYTRLNLHADFLYQQNDSILHESDAERSRDFAVGFVTAFRYLPELREHDQAVV